MQFITNIFWVLVALCGFGLLITVHEVGHCIAAKRAGVRVNEFWIGMGPRLLQRKVGETNYCLCLLPLGGACVMEGEDDNTNPDAHAFSRASRFRRFTILIAGVAMNFLLGFIIVLMLLAPANQFYTKQIESLESGFAYGGTNGLMAGDELLSVNGYPIWQRSDVQTGFAYAEADGYFDIIVQRDGNRIKLERMHLTRDFTNDAGDAIYGINFAVTDATVLRTLREAFFTTCNYARLVWDSIYQLATGAVGVDQLSGPVGVTSVMAQTAASSMRSFGWVLAFISVNLGVMNLLPIPGLDGGRLVFLLIECIIRRPLNKKIEMIANMGGLLALFALIFYVTGNDIMRLIAG